MADIEYFEVTIKIPHAIKERIDNYKDIELVDMSYLIYAIRNGIPLPKGHGDIVDLNAMIDTYWDGNYMEIHTYDLPNIPVIVKAESEDKE